MVRRLQQRDAIDAMVKQFGASYPQRYGGLYIEHTPA